MGLLQEVVRASLGSGVLWANAHIVVLKCVTRQINHVGVDFVYFQVT
jgi:hypothetical protein